MRDFIGKAVTILGILTFMGALTFLGFMSHPAVGFLVLGLFMFLFGIFVI